ncbi:unnamed protein product, partial [Ixodes persulcatus]
MPGNVPHNHNGHHRNDRIAQHVHAGIPSKVRVLNVLTHYLIIVGTFHLYSVGFIVNRWDESERDVDDFRQTKTKPKDATQDHTHALKHRVDTLHRHATMVSVKQ